MLAAVLDPVLSSRRTATDAAQRVSVLSRAEQDFILRWVAVIAGTNAELAFQFAAAAPAALSTMDIGTAEAWAVHALDTYDREGLHRGTSVLLGPDVYARSFGRPSAVRLEDIADILHLFVRGLAGRTMPLAAAPRPYTDGETLYLPPVIASAATADGNFFLYKATATLLWAQDRYGTYDVDLAAACSRFDDSARALKLLSALETIRLEARLADELPGIHRGMRVLCAGGEHDPRCERLLDPGAAVADSIALLESLYDAPPLFDDPYSIVLAPGQRVPRGIAQAEALIEFNAPAPPSTEEVLDRRAEREPSAMPVPDETGASYVYDEWDHRRSHYRRDWCTLRVTDVEPGDEAFVGRTLAKHAFEISRLKRTFELLRGEERVLKRQPEGDAIDFDALVDAFSDLRAGAELSPLLFTRRRRDERDLAVMFMIDMSGSTKGWVNEAEREALVMLCEALEVLGDRYAIYGFSGLTRKRCEVFRVKRFDEPYGGPVRARIAAIEPHDYTRMGVAIRHLSMLLNAVDARTRLLVTLSDGKPDDYSDEYRGEYGIEDTRQALLEAHRSGIRPFCITIDREARDYLPHMYGAVNWTLVDDVALLPARVAAIYRRLTL
jgi:nitric oxide reductase NorD protein